MKALVIGGDSSLGRVLGWRLEDVGHDVIRTTRRRENSDIPGWVYFDMMNPILNGVFDVFEPTVIYIMAAVTGILRCEEDPNAWFVNAEAPGIIAREVHKARSYVHIISMSSGTVERGQHTASARQKSYADAAILALGGCVVRPLPHVPSLKYEEFVNLLIELGDRQHSGLVRWGAECDTRLYWE